MSNYTDPTATAALGTIEREWREKKELARRLRRLRKLGLLDDRLRAFANHSLNGIFSPLYLEIFRD